LAKSPQSWFRGGRTDFTEKRISTSSRKIRSISPIERITS